MGLAWFVWDGVSLCSPEYLELAVYHFLWDTKVTDLHNNAFFPSPWMVFIHSYKIMNVKVWRAGLLEWKFLRQRKENKSLAWSSSLFFWSSIQGCGTGILTRYKWFPALAKGDPDLLILELLNSQGPEARGQRYLIQIKSLWTLDSRTVVSWCMLESRKHNNPFLGFWCRDGSSCLVHAG